MNFLTAIGITSATDINDQDCDLSCRPTSSRKNSNEKRKKENTTRGTCAIKVLVVLLAVLAIAISFFSTQNTNNVVLGRHRVREDKWGFRNITEELEVTSVTEFRTKGKTQPSPTGHNVLSNGIGSVLYIPQNGPSNQLVGAVTAAWLASLAPGSRVRVQDVERHYIERHEKGHSLNPFLKEAVFSNTVLAQNNFSIDSLTHVVFKPEDNAQRNMSLVDFIQREQGRKKKYYGFFQATNGFPDTLPVETFSCNIGETLIQCLIRALRDGRNVLVTKFNPCNLRVNLLRHECTGLYNFMKGGFLRKLPLPSHTPKFQVSIQLRLTDRKDKRLNVMQKDFRAVHYKGKALRYKGQFSTRQMIDTLLEVHHGPIYVTFPHDAEVAEYMRMKNKPVKRLYAPSDFKADMLLDQTLAASATTFIHDIASTYSVMIDAHRPVNSSLVRIDEWIRKHSNST